jgi:outer membrane receptor protein involved in Fe transport
VDARTEDADVDDVTGPIDEDSTITGFYVQDQVLLGDGIKVTAGLRADHNSEFGTEWSPRLAVLLRPRDDLDLFASVNRAHRAPALSDRFVRAQFNGFEFIGNPGLEPETLTAYELGGRARFDSGVRAELAVFYTDLEDGFEYALAEDGTFRNRNVAGSRTYGVEANLDVALTDSVRAFAGYTFTDGEIDDFPTNPQLEGNQLAYLAEQVGSVGLQYTGRWGQHTVSARYVDERFIDDANTLENRLDDHVVVDLSGRVPVGEQAALTLNVNNLFDESYEDYPRVEAAGTTVIGGVELVF